MGRRRQTKAAASSSAEDALTCISPTSRKNRFGIPGLRSSKNKNEKKKAPSSVAQQHTKEPDDVSIPLAPDLEKAFSDSPSADAVTITTAAGDSMSNMSSFGYSNTEDCLLPEAIQLPSQQDAPAETTEAPHHHQTPPRQEEGEDERTIRKFQQMLNRPSLSLTERVNLLYGLGRLSTKLALYEQALQYHQQELELTQDLAETHHGTHDGEEPDFDAVPRVLDDMARIAQRGLNDFRSALEYYQAALSIRIAHYKELAASIKADCPECAGAHRACPTHYRTLQEASKAVEVTRQNMGRILFEQGDVDRAVKMIPRIGP